MGLLDRMGRERLIFGHRGVPDEAPENTIAGFEMAVNMGLDGVELDVRVCKTGELVIMHDDEVDKVTDGSGLIEELSFDELRELDAGVKFPDRFKGEKIPALDEVLEVMGGKMIINIELKTKSIPDDGLEAKVIPVVEKMGLQESVVMSSFNPFSVWRTTKLNPDLKAALLYADDQPIHLRRAWGLHFMKVDGIHPKFPLIDEKLMKRARANGWFVNTWTVDDEVAVTEMFEAGVAIVITNHPRRMQQKFCG